MTKERKLILTLGLVLLVFGLLYRFAPDYHSFMVSDDEIALKQKKLAQHLHMLKKKPGLEARFSASKTALARAEKMLLNGTTPALAAVDMQNIIKGIAYKTGIEIASFQVLTTVEPDAADYIDIPVRFQITSTIRQLKDILYGMESSDKLLKITEISSGSVRRKPKSDEPVYVRSVVTVAGYMAKE